MKKAVLKHGSHYVKNTQVDFRPKWGIPELTTDKREAKLFDSLEEASAYDDLLVNDFQPTIIEI